MRPTFWQRLDAFARHQLPLVLTLMLLVLAMTPNHLPGFVRIGPMVTLVSVYYWTVHRPDLMGFGTVFALGVIEDLLAGTPLGVGPLTLLLTQGLVLSQHKFFHNKSFAVIWWAFALIAGGGALVQYFGVSIVHGQLLDPRAAFTSYLMSVALYPLLAWLFTRVQIAFLKEV